jgi:hypothetical protein
MACSGTALNVGDGREKYAHCSPNRFLVLQKQRCIILLGHLFLYYIYALSFPFTHFLQLLLKLFTYLVYYFSIPKHKLHINAGNHTLKRFTTGMLLSIMSLLLFTINMPFKDNAVTRCPEAGKNYDLYVTLHNELVIVTIIV